MFIKKIAYYLAIILSFTSLSFNSYAEKSDNFLLLYESYNKLNKIEEIIENSETKILTKYGVNQEYFASNELILEPSIHFIGYQVKRFNDRRLIELKFSKASIEKFFQDKSVPYLAFEGKTKVYIGVNDSFFQNSNLFIIEDSDFQNELINSKLISKLNQNISIEFDFINEFPSTSYEKDDLLIELSNMSQGDWTLMLIDRFDLINWSINFPKTSKIFIQNSFEFQNLLLDEVLAEVKKTNIASEKNYFTVAFDLDMSEDEFANLVDLFSRSTDILHFRVKQIENSYIIFEYETYLDEEKAHNFMFRSGAVDTR
tara:strand:- start:1044 stop:1985 length:942 start_codon:yes stop_codon:yes gene_type:complete